MISANRSGPTGPAGPPGPGIPDDNSVTGAKVAIRWEDLRFPVTTANIGGTLTPPEFVIFRGGVAAYRFRYTRDDDFCFSVQLPHGWVPGIVKPHVHWSPGSNGVAQNGKAVKFIIEYTPASFNTDFPPTQLADFTDTITGTDYRHEITPEKDIDLTGFTPSTVILCRLYRDNSVVDNAPVGIFVTDVDFHIQMKGLGTVNSDGSGGM
jgi:hypothetical protein